MSLIQLNDDVRDAAIRVRGEELLTVKEYSVMTRLHPESIRRRIRAGRQLGAVRVGGQWRIDATLAITRAPA